MLKRILLSCLALFLLMPAALAADLDAPAQKQVTVRSEIQRGNAAIDDVCTGKYGVLNTLNAFDRALGRNKQNNTDTDAFLLGAYWAITWRMNLEITFESNTKEEKLLAKDRFSFYYKNFRKKQQALGLSDKQFSEALGMIYDNVKKDLEKWDSLVNATATS